jgi:hypothetical protein
MQKFLSKFTEKINSLTIVVGVNFSCDTATHPMCELALLLPRMIHYLVLDCKYLLTRKHFVLISFL